MKHRLPLAACLLALTAASFACAPEAPPVQGSAAQGGGGSDVCKPLSSLGSAIARTKTLNAFSTPGEVAKLQSEFDKAMTALIPVADPALDLEALEEQVDKFSIFADRVAPGLTIGASASLLQGQAVHVQREYDRVVEAAGCAD